MLFSYRTRRFFGRLLRALLPIAVVAVLALLCWLLWLQRFVIFTPEGLKLDLSLPPLLQGQVAKPTEPEIWVDILYGSPEDDKKDEDPTTQLLAGYYVSEESLYTDIPGVLAKLKRLPKGTPVLVDVKNYRGYFYYSTTVGSQNYGKVNTAHMDELIAYLGESDLYVIARLPALSDYVYGAENPSAGMPLASGALYFDENKCYWLDPTDEDTITYLIQISRELRALGFDEVVFTEFRIPDTDKIVFEADKRQSISDAAQAIVAACATEDFVVSFAADTPDFPIPAQRSRLYMLNVQAADVADVAAQLKDIVPPSRLVFFADNTDNRYNSYGVLRPVDLASFDSE